MKSTAFFTCSKICLSRTKIKSEVDKLISLKDQIRAVIDILIFLMDEETLINEQGNYIVVKVSNRVYG